jgi:hypothetical protein
MVAAGAAGTVITLRRGEPTAIWLTLAFFTVMEALQAGGYAVIDQCGSPANRWVTILSYLHIAAQPLFVNAFAMTIAPVRVSARMRRRVFALAGAASAVLVLRLVPLGAVGACAPGEILCGPAWCTRAGEWHIAWDVPLNGLPAHFGIPGQFPSYLLAVFLLPLFYGAWRFVAFHALAGPVLAMLSTSDPNEMPAIWCLFSIGILAVSLSPVIRYRVMGAAGGRPRRT